MLDVCIPAINGAIAAVLEGKTIPRLGNRHPSACPCNTYPTADGEIWIYCLTEAHWRQLVELMGRGELLDESRFRNEAARCKNFGEVDGLVGQWTSTIKRDDLVELLLASNIPCAPVREIEEVAHDPELEARGLIRTTEYGGYDKVKVLGSAIKMSGVAGDEISTKVPELGEHNREILGRIGIDAAELEALHRDGAI